ncbi:hypothetical protein MHOMSp_01508 [Metamycoplasma hominis]|nr:hypothetical protein [Metamycoplasma hominis]AKJ52544.1 hypothetical protein MHOMSp_01508 [Metamycoplasma hominis]
MNIYKKDNLDKFLKREDLPNFWHIYVYCGSAGWIKPWKWIRDGYPCLIFGTYIPDTWDDQKIGHAVVAYGMYDNGNKLLCHYGWAGSSQVIVSSSLSGQLFLLAIKPNGEIKKQDNILLKTELNIREWILNNEENYIKMVNNFRSNNAYCFAFLCNFL